MPSPTIDRIARKNAPVQVPILPSVLAVASAAQRKDLVVLGASRRSERGVEKAASVGAETAIAAALLSVSTTSTGTGTTGPQGPRKVSVAQLGATGPQGPAGADGVSTVFPIEEGGAGAVYAGITPNRRGDSLSVLHWH